MSRCHRRSRTTGSPDFQMPHQLCHRLSWLHSNDTDSTPILERGPNQVFWDWPKCYPGLPRVSKSGFECQWPNDKEPLFQPFTEVWVGAVFGGIKTMGAVETVVISTENNLEQSCAAHPQDQDHRGILDRNFTCLQWTKNERLRQWL